MPIAPSGAVIKIARTDIVNIRLPDVTPKVNGLHQ